MANVFVDLPLPALNGPGAAVDTSMMGIPKTIEVVGAFPGSTIAVEVSEDGGATFATVAMFQDVGGKQVLDVVAQFMRVNVLGRKGALPFSADAGVAAPAGVPLFAGIAMPAGNGPGVPTDISAFGAAVTLVLGGSFFGSLIAFETSVDGTEPYTPLFSFAGKGGQQSAVVTANFIRANVSGRKSSVPFTATAALGGASSGTVGEPSPYAPPEQWAQNRPIKTNLVNVPLCCQVSTSFDNWQAIVAGSVVGMGIRFAKPITNGGAVIAITINGVPNAGLQLVCNAGANPTGGIVTVASGTVPYAATDLIGLAISTDGVFAPTNNDVEVQIRVQDT